MTTLTNIAVSAFRESGIIPVGETPDSAELSEALEKLQTLISSIFGWELGEYLVDVNYGTNGLSSSRQNEEDATSFIQSNYVPANTRLIMNISEATTLYLPPNPKDGARFGVVDSLSNFSTYNVTLNGNSRKVESSATVTLTTAGLVREWFYRADLGTWQRVTSLTGSSESPFPSEFDDMLAIMLAYRLNPRYGATTAPETNMVLQNLKKKFKTKYAQKKEVGLEDALLKLGPSWYHSSISNFNRGH